MRFLRLFRNYCSRNNYFSIFRRLFSKFLTNFYLHLTKRIIDDLSIEKSMYFFSFHFCLWKCFCFRSRFILWDLDSRYFYFRSQSRSHNLVYETSRSRNSFCRIDILFLNRVLLIFFIIEFFCDWKSCWWRSF